MPVVQIASVGRRPTLLQTDGALRGIDGADERDQHAVADGFGDLATMFGNARFWNLSASNLERSQRAGFVQLHRRAVAGPIGGKNGNESALHAKTPRGMTREQ